MFNFFSKNYKSKNHKTSKFDDEKVNIKYILADLSFYIVLGAIAYFLVWNNSDESLENLRSPAEENRLVFWSLFFTGLFFLTQYMDFKKTSKIIIKKPKKNNQ